MSVENPIVAVDLFCGVGGLTHGLTKAGIKVRLGVDLDPACRFPMQANNAAKFLEADVGSLMPSDIQNAFGDSEITLLAGCAPCQPFSSYAQSAKRDGPHEDWELLTSFSKLVLAVRPTLVTMENVPPLSKQQIFKDFVSDLHTAGYYVDFKAVDGRTIGLPQRRQRLVLVASLLGPITIPDADKAQVSVRDTIGGLPALTAGASDPNDPLHASASLSELNLSRIRHSTPGGTWRDWPKDLISGCHARESGSTYPSVYGRMEWDKPAPTMTTQCYGFGNGRFGHPEQDRAISLREAAMIQSFPKDYQFIPDGEPINFSTLGRMIGNAVPVLLGEFIGEILVNHVKSCGEKS
ncbi:DNA (cytosine-5)-methyltransferase 1 [Phyllobacterium sp. CL33Tsu]|uniref:DNA cytosine methyltransferase n=1 Tax=Phyllobacterium sp. CL33Tsu TaxID=1798191 RepID=UPI0008E0D9EA|nr:DNA cytosine methyltransferase [Phyllobacterium sp. CL33Tsu]SFI61667.1 DNA (cytosine-5)-methyltransferase 1 [Phyllobacterium sp. CL33Tsu]